MLSLLFLFWLSINFNVKKSFIIWWGMCGRNLEEMDTSVQNDILIYYMGK
jgi:hypothetical protein